RREEVRHHGRQRGRYRGAEVAVDRRLDPRGHRARRRCTSTRRSDQRGAFHVSSAGRTTARPTGIKPILRLRAGGWGGGAASLRVGGRGARGGGGRSVGCGRGGGGARGCSSRGGIDSHNGLQVPVRPGGNWGEPIGFSVSGRVELPPTDRKSVV